MDAMQHAVIAACLTLEPVKDWPAFGARAEDVRLYLHGQSGLEKRIAKQLCRWAKIWSAGPQDARDFLACHAGTAWASKCLWHIFEGYPLPTDHPAYWEMSKQWQQYKGYKPARRPIWRML